MKKLLHVGCNTLTKKDTIPYFQSDDWGEIRFDIDCTVKPDVVGSLTDMSALANESIDAIYSAHNLEHLFEHEIEVALLEFRRVLKQDGFIVITCPDLQSVCRLIAKQGLQEPAYVAQCGTPVTPHDILYGWGPPIKNGNLFMAHKSGFDSQSMHHKLANAGYVDYATFISEPAFALWAVARKGNVGQAEINEFARSVFIGML